MVLCGSALIIGSCSSQNAAPVMTAAPATSAAPTTTTSMKPLATRPPRAATAQASPAPARITRGVTNPATPSPTIAEAIDRGATFARDNFDQLDAPTQLVASNLGLTYRLAPLADTRDRALTKLNEEATISNPLLYATAPMYRRMVWRDDPIDPVAITQLTTAARQEWIIRTQWLWGTAFLCGSPEFPADWGTQVRNMLALPANAGGMDLAAEAPRSYVASHAALGLAGTLEHGCALPDAAALQEAIVRKVQSAFQKPFVPDDASIEGVVALQLLGRADLVPPEWIEQIRAAQRPDGGWDRRAKTSVPTAGSVPSQSDVHTTFLAIWALAAHQDPAAAGPFFR